MEDKNTNTLTLVILFIALGSVWATLFEKAPDVNIIEIIVDSRDLILIFGGGVSLVGALVAGIGMFRERMLLIRSGLSLVVAWLLPMVALMVIQMVV